MSDTRNTAAAFATGADPFIIAAFAHQAVKLPLRVCEEEKVVILDNHGMDVLTVDSNSNRPDDQAEAIALLIVKAVNQLAGFHAHNGGHEHAPAEAVD